MRDQSTYKHMWQDITEKQKKEFNALATHPLQTYEWGEFRKKTGVIVVRKGLFDGKKLSQTLQITIHPIPYTPYTIGYFPKGTLPTQELLTQLTNIGKVYKCIFIQLEPNVEKSQIPMTKSPENRWDLGFGNWNLRSAAHPLFTKYTLQLDLTKSEEELLKNMHPKTRYNIKVAQKHDVTITENDSLYAFTQYWKLLQETTQRQHFFAHTKKYHELMWETLKSSKSQKTNHNELKAYLFLAEYQKQVLTAWVLFTFKDTLYYPYGASSREHRDVMAQNLMMWEAIRFGKEKKLKLFDMWGSLGEDPNPSDPWYGFHRFKMGYAPKLVEFIGSYDLVLNPILYFTYTVADKFRWLLLRLSKK